MQQTPMSHQEPPTAAQQQAMLAELAAAASAPPPTEPVPHEPPVVPVIRVLKVLTPVVISPPPVPKGMQGLSSRTFKDSVEASAGVLIRVDWTSRVVWLGWTYDVPDGGDVTVWTWTPCENIQFASCHPEASS